MNPGTGCLYVFGGKSAEAGEDQVISSVCLPTWTVIYRTSNAVKRASQINSPKGDLEFSEPPATTSHIWEFGCWPQQPCFVHWLGVLSCGDTLLRSETS